MAKTKKIKTTIRIDEKLLKEIKKRAVDKNISLSKYITQLFEEEFKEISP